MKKRERKGFTLIELLVTIAIVSLITIITFIAVNKVMDVTKENKNKLSIKNIQASARTYVEEFKRDEKHWFVGNSGDTTEYACATVWMLINKGLLKENILNTEIDGKKITKSTSIMIQRNRETKVLTNEELIFNTTECLEDNVIDIIFNVTSGTEGNSVINEEGETINWYKSGSDIKMEIKTVGELDDNFTPQYYFKRGDEQLEIQDFDNYSKISEIIIDEQGKELDLCITNLVTTKSNLPDICLSSKTDKLYIDLTNPDVGSLVLDTNYNLLANTATDNITSSDNIKYYLTYDSETETTGSATYNIDDSTRITDKEVKVYVKDEAGNVSETVTKTLNIEDSKNGTVTSETTYYCSLNNKEYSSESAATSACTETGEVKPATYSCSLNNNTYSSESAATSACTETGEVKPATYSCSLDNNTYSSESAATSACIKTGTVTPTTTYSCSLNSNTYSSQSAATADCTSTTTGTVTSSKVYYCSLNDNEYSTKSAATSACTEQGDYTTTYSCSSGTTLSGTKCYSYSSATKSTMYGLTCAAGTTTTYGWSSTGTTSGLTSCSSSSASCSKSSHVGNTKTACTSYEEHTKTYSTDDECAKYAPSNCSCDVHDGEGYYVMCPRYKKTTYSCKATTTTSSTKTYTGTTGGSTSGGCPSGTTATLDDSKSTCDSYIGDTCSGNCSSCCGDYKYYTCSSSTSATKKYYCEEDGETYSSSSSCEKVGSVTSDTKYYCSLNSNTYSSRSAAETACTKTTTGTVTPKTTYSCSLNSNTYSSESAATSACTQTETVIPATYSCSLNSNTYSSESAATSACIETGTVTPSTYSCSLNSNTYSSESAATSSCIDIKSVDEKEKYYCDLTDKSYSSQTTANNKCTNYCSNGTYYNSACYSLN